MSGRVLVLEDDPHSMELTKYLLAAHGYDAIPATRGDEGLSLAREVNPDLILCDIQLPVMDGYAVTRALKQDPVLRTIPVIAVTALAMVGDREKVIAAGFDAYISKPIDPDTFVAAIKPFLGREATR